MNDKQEPQSKPDKQADSKDSIEAPGRKAKPLVSRVLIYGGLFAILGSWASIYGNLGHTFWIFAVSVMLIATVCLALGLRLELRNNHRPKLEYNGIAGLVVVLGFFLGIPVIVKELLRIEPVPPKPHLRLLLSTPDNPEYKLPLTNTFLLFKNDVFLSPLTNGFLVIPMAPGESDISIRFSVQNDSSVPAEGVQVLFMVDPRVEFLPDPEWLWATTGNKVPAIGYRFTPIMYPGDTLGLPLIRFKTTTNGFDSVLTIVMREKNMGEIHFSAFIEFPRWTWRRQPWVGFPKPSSQLNEFDVFPSGDTNPSYSIHLHMQGSDSNQLHRP